MEVIQNTNYDNDFVEEMKKFVETKAGVKGLVDSGLAKLPRIFIKPPQLLSKYPSNSSGNGTVPVIDLKGLDNADRRTEIVNEIRQAAETWGFCHLINHGVPADVIDNALEGVKKFHEQPPEVKNDDIRKLFDFSTSAKFKLSAAADWRDFLSYNCLDQQLEEEALPQICRKTLSEYIKYIFQLKDTLSKLLSEALGFCPDSIEKIECMKSGLFVGNYYPACPEPDLALAIDDHSDMFFLTILANDNVGGLQVLHNNHWVDVPSMQGSLIANLGDMMQIISNDKFKSVVHRVWPGDVTRTSLASFFLPSSSKTETPYGPLEELISYDSPPMYPRVSVSEYKPYYFAKRGDGEETISNFKLQRLASMK